MIRICLDPGHGGSDPGATNGKLKESHLNLAIAQFTSEFLMDYDCDVIMTRNIDREVSLSDRCVKSNTSKATCFVSIHCNSYPDSKVNGLETYSLGGNDLQTNIHLHLINNVPYKKDRGMKKENFFVLRNTSCTSVLVECGFISNDNDSQCVSENKRLIGTSIARGIIATYNIQPKKREVHRVMVGSYTSLDNAENMKNNLIKDGYKPIIIKATI